MSATSLRTAREERMVESAVCQRACMCAGSWLCGCTCRERLTATTKARASVEHSAAERGHLMGMRVEAKLPPHFQGGRRHLKDAQRKGQFFAHEASTRASCVEPDAHLLRGAHPSDAQNRAGHEHVQHPLIHTRMRSGRSEARGCTRRPRPHR